jgi:hypothetical protein
VGDFPDSRTVKSLPGEKLLRGAFDFAPVLGDGVVQKLGHFVHPLAASRRALALGGEF